MVLKVPEQATEPAPPPDLPAAETQWGVRHGSHLRVDGHTGIEVDVRKSEADARHWRESLKFCGNADAELVARTGSDGVWWGFTDLMGSADVASLLRMDVRTVNRWAKAGRLVTVRDPSWSRHGHYLFSRQQVAHILAGGEW